MGCQQGKQSAPTPKSKNGKEVDVKSPLLLGNELPMADSKQQMPSEPTFDDLREELMRSSAQPCSKKFNDAINEEDSVEAMDTFAVATEPEPDSETTPRHTGDDVTPSPAVVTVEETRPVAPAPAAVLEKVAAPPAPAVAEASPEVGKRAQPESRNEPCLHKALTNPRDIPAPAADVLITAKDVGRALDASAARIKAEAAGKLKVDQLAKPNRREKNNCCC